VIKVTLCTFSEQLLPKCSDNYNVCILGTLYSVYKSNVFSPSNSLQEIFTPSCSYHLTVLFFLLSSYTPAQFGRARCMFLVASVCQD